MSVSDISIPTWAGCFQVLQNTPQRVTCFTAGHLNISQPSWYCSARLPQTSDVKVGAKELQMPPKWSVFDNLFSSPQANTASDYSWQAFDARRLVSTSFSIHNTPTYFLFYLEFTRYVFSVVHSVTWDLVPNKKYISLYAVASDIISMPKLKILSLRNVLIKKKMKKGMKPASCADAGTAAPPCDIITSLTIRSWFRSSEIETKRIYFI